MQLKSMVCPSYSSLQLQHSFYCIFQGEMGYFLVHIRTYIDKSKLQIQSLKSVQNQYTNNMLNMGSKANLWQRLGYTKILNLNLFPARTRLKKSLTIWEHCCASKELGFRKLSEKKLGFKLTW